MYLGWQLSCVGRCLQVILMGRESNMGRNIWRGLPFEKRLGSAVTVLYCLWQHIRPVIGWEKWSMWAYSCIFRFTHQPHPMGKWNSCLAISGAVRRHFLPNYSSCIMNNYTDHHQQPVDLSAELTLFYLNATLTRRWATFSFPYTLPFQIARTVPLKMI